jgi:hypothetical protein
MADFNNHKGSAMKESVGSYGLKAEPCHFPSLDGDACGSKKVSTISVNVTEWQELHALGSEKASDIAHTAWALVLRCYTGSNDVCYGIKNARNGGSFSETSMMRLRFQEDTSLARLTVAGQIEDFSNGSLEDTMGRISFNTAMTFSSNALGGVSGERPFMTTEFEEVSISHPDITSAFSLFDLRKLS